MTICQALQPIQCMSLAGERQLKQVHCNHISNLPTCLGVAIALQGLNLESSHKTLLSTSPAMLRVVLMTSGTEVLSLCNHDLEADADADARLTVRGLKESGLHDGMLCAYLGPDMIVAANSAPKWWTCILANFQHPTSTCSGPVSVNKAAAMRFGK